MLEKETSGWLSSIFQNKYILILSGGCRAGPHRVIAWKGTSGETRAGGSLRSSRPKHEHWNHRYAGEALKLSEGGPLGEGRSFGVTGQPLLRGCDAHAERHLVGSGGNVSEGARGMRALLPGHPLASRWRWSQWQSYSCIWSSVSSFLCWIGQLPNDYI